MACSNHAQIHCQSVLIDNSLKITRPRPLLCVFVQERGTHIEYPELPLVLVSFQNDGNTETVKVPMEMCVWRLKKYRDIPLMEFSLSLPQTPNATPEANSDNDRCITHHPTDIDIHIVQEQTGAERAECIKALDACHGDVVESVFYLENNKSGPTATVGIPPLDSDADSSTAVTVNVRSTSGQSAHFEAKVCYYELVRCINTFCINTFCVVCCADSSQFWTERIPSQSHHKRKYVRLLDGNMDHFCFQAGHGVEFVQFMLCRIEASSSTKQVRRCRLWKSWNRDK